MRNYQKKAAGIEYMGVAGCSSDCKNAVIKLLQFGTRITLVKILTYKKHHCLLLTINNDDTIAIKSGFGSGYAGEGARTFSYVLGLFDYYDIEIEEHDVRKDLIARLDLSALTIGDLEKLKDARPIRPSRWRDYEFKDDWERNLGAFWQEFPPVIPFSIIDERITDLAMKFIERPDEILLSGYRRLEDIVRQRTGSKEHNTNLFQEAFLSNPPKLKWNNVNDAEKKGRGMLFTAAYMAHRNPRAHKELKESIDHQLGEFLLLNHLYTLEKEAENE